VLRCLRGLEEEEIDNLLDMVGEGKILLQNKREPIDFESMEDFCKDIKEIVAMKIEIIEYFTL